jgi:endonuclease YncB( thermonuclease family)
LCRISYNSSIRLKGIDAPEMKTKNAEEVFPPAYKPNYHLHKPNLFSLRINKKSLHYISIALQKKHAEAARNALHKFVFQKYIELKNVETEKYGRVLADVFVGGVNINKWMIENAHAVAYIGDRKRDWEDIAPIFRAGLQKGVDGR